MLDIKKVDHVGIRVSDKDRAVEFYEMLGFQFLVDGGFDGGHPVIMRHPGGIVVNLLGPANRSDGSNILMDADEKYPGYTHVALRVESIDSTRAFFEERDIEITGSFSFKDVHSIFVRDPDRNVIEITAYEGGEPLTRLYPDTDFSAYADHP